MSETIEREPEAQNTPEMERAETAAPRAAEASTSSAPTIGWVGVAAITLGLALRCFFLATGRTTVDGDEGIMGIMAHHLASFERLPLYFYRQHYMGAIEVPLLAAVDFFLPVSWRFTAWPIRLVQTAYFITMILLAFKLFSKFFGERVGRWTVFFLAIAPVYWIDYSQRLRHVVFMMLIGQIMALISLRAVERWDEEKRVTIRLWAVLGATIGLAWWHYQLVAIFFAGAFALLLSRPKMAWGWFARPGSSRPDFGNLARLSLIVAPCVLVAGMTMGWGGKHWVWFPHVIGSALAMAAVGVALAWRAAKRSAAANSSDPANDPRLAPFLVSAGFLVGFAPAMLYLVTLEEEFWVNPLNPDLTKVLAHTRDLFMMEVSAILEITRAIEPFSNMHTVDARSYVNLALYPLAIFALARRAIKPEGPRERLGVGFLLAVFAALIAMHVLTPRRTNWSEPRFLVPIFLVVAVGLAALVSEFQTAVMGALKTGRARLIGNWSFAGAIVMGSIALWGKGWLALPGEKISWPSGHRQSLVVMREALRAHDVDTIVFDPVTNWVLLGYETQFMSALELRCNRGGMGDRLVGLIDESRYKGPEFLLTTAERADFILKDQPGDVETKVKNAGGFQAGDLWAFPLPPGYIIRGRYEIPPPPNKSEE